MILESGTESCPCKRAGCERHGDCAACLVYHSGKKHPPYCKRKKGSGAKKGKNEQNI